MTDSVFRACFLALSLARGRLVAPALPVGFDSVGVPRFAEWRGHVVDQWKSGWTWFPHSEAGTVENVIPLVHERCSDEFWAQVLTRCIRMYVSSNTPDPLDMAIPAAQMGLELLGWAVLVEQEEWLWQTEGRITASRMLRLLLKWGHIPAEIPNQLPALAQLGAERELDGPAVVVWVRNRLVHVRPTEPMLNTDVLRDAWKLVTHYLELCILKAIGYEGAYVNRVTAMYLGDVEMVPWRATSGPDAVGSES